MNEILSAAEIYLADKLTTEKFSISGEQLMENAGTEISKIITQKYQPCAILVLCGLGNNGGDGFVVARLLQTQGFTVQLCVFGDDSKIKNDALLAKAKWLADGGEIKAFSNDLLKEAALIIDAILGVGLSKNIEGEIAQAIDYVNKSKLPIIAVDIPSGVNADDGKIMGVAIQASETISFFRPKLGHYLLPGKEYIGRLHIVDIGIPNDVLLEIKVQNFLNEPSLWQNDFPHLKAASNKYDRGHAIIIGGEMQSAGAAKIAAYSALRSGSGLVSVACSSETLLIYAESLMAVMTKLVDSEEALTKLIDDKRTSAFLIGPGSGLTQATKEKTQQILLSRKACVIDADAISVFADNPKEIFALTHENVIFTPHSGEFKRIFDDSGSKIENAKKAAQQSGAVVILKGNDTIIASPDGRLAINHNAPNWLATAGSGDALAGIATGLLAQHMPTFEAACAAVWLHSEAANFSSIGMIAEDLIDNIPKALSLIHI